MRHFLMTVLTVALIAGAGQPRADEPAGAIRSVIERQLAAFLKSDLEGAFAFASPGIQRMFRDPANFGRMVQQGYPMVWRPARWEMRDLVETDAGPVQVVLFEDADGILHEADYLMEMVDGAWRIAGVRLRRLPGVGT